jgi:hypothetical protein
MSEGDRSDMELYVDEDGERRVVERIWWCGVTGVGVGSMVEV